RRVGARHGPELSLRQLREHLSRDSGLQRPADQRPARRGPFGPGQHGGRRGGLLGHAAARTAVRLPVALTIAGSDSGGGAGIQADLKTFAALGVHGTSAVTALPAQTPLGVRDYVELPLDIIRAQIDEVVSDLSPAAVKTGMLSSSEIIEVAATAIEELGLENLVVDPVMVAKGGGQLLRPEAVTTLVARL